jgi:hypothetical protein
MNLDKEIVMYSRAGYSPYVALARDVLGRYNIPHREINIEVDQAMARRVELWTGRLSVPTLVVSAPGDGLPLEPPIPLEPGQQVRGVDRGSMITAPNNRQLENWLHRHGFLPKPYTR